MTSCGETSELKAAVMHGVVSALYLIMLAWHLNSVLKHLGRHD